MSVANNERKAKRIIKRLVEDRKLTDQGANWLTMATDPFHDTEITPTGYPDLNSCSTLTQCFTYTQSITAPATVGEWDSHVFFVPLSRTQGFSPSTLTVVDRPLTQCLTEAATGATKINPSSPFAGPSVYGGLNVVTGLSGTNLFTNGSDSSIASKLQFPLVGGQFRLVACGFEVVNTTPDLYKGGSVTVYRAPSQRDATSSVVYNPAAGSYPIIANTANWIPYTQAEAQLYPTSRTWAAQDGCYVIPTMCRDDNTFSVAIPNSPLFIQPPSQVEISLTVTSSPIWTEIRSRASRLDPANSWLRS